MHGYRDGVPGLVLSLLFAFYRFEMEAKVWEASGCGAEWDREVRRLRSPTRLLGALTSEALRRLLNRVRGRTLVVRGPGDTMPVTASSREAPAGPPSGTDGQRQ
jgi:hypothetical protein